MHAYGTKDVERVVGVRSGSLRSLIRAGHVKPSRGRGRRYEFSFQDLVVLRTAKALAEARVPSRRILRCLRELRASLPESIPLTGLSVTAVGDRVAVREGSSQRDFESGQYLMALSVEIKESELSIVELSAAAPGTEGDVQQHYQQGCRSEEGGDVEAALEAYRRCLSANRDHVDARINCGRLLHLAGRLVEAEAMYRGAREADATLLFNVGVLLQDLDRDEEAAAAYREALAIDPDFADAYYNLACLHERAGNQRECIRHLMAYRRASR
jgi:tetratricopeptide (TPR) repeat protein